MGLTNEEFGRLEAARTNSMHHRVTQNKRVLQLAFEHIEALSHQHAKALSMIEAFVNLRKKSLCYRVPAFLYLQWVRVKGLFTRRAG